MSKYRLKQSGRARYIGRHLRLVEGSIYLSASFTLIVILVGLLVLTYMLQIFILTNDINSALNIAAAEAVTSIRRDYYDALAESNADFIDSELASGPSNTYITYLRDESIRALSIQLACSNSPFGTLSKPSRDSDHLYKLDTIGVTYSGSIFTMTAELNIPIRFGGRHITDYQKKMEVSYGLSFK